MLKMEQKMCESNQENSIKTGLCRTAQAEPPRQLIPRQEPAGAGRSRQEPAGAGRSLGTSVFEVAIGEKCRIFIELHIQAGAEVRKWILGAVTLSTVLSIGRILIRLS